MECQVHGITMYYEEVGTGRPLLMLHGLPLDHRSMANAMEPLFANRTGWRRLYPDLPGMGKTRAADWITHQDQMLDVVSTFMTAVAPGERFVVAGASYGGYLARGLVSRRGGEMDGLLLIVPVVEADVTNRDLPQPLVVREDAAFLAALTPDEQDMRKFIVVQSMDVLTADRHYIRPAVAVADHAFLQRLRQQFSFSFDPDTLPIPFPAPALFLSGRQDSVCGYRDAFHLLGNYPRATFAALDSAGHALVFEQEPLFRALVNEWLDRVEGHLDATYIPSP